jgi:hypothetical protein
MYEFQHKGKKYKLPNFADIPMGALRKARKGKDELDVTFTMVEQMVGEDSPVLAAIDDMNAAQFQELISGWTQGAGLGEAQRSES